MKAFPDSKRKQLFFTLLKVLGGSRAVVTFDGSGDSGSIDSVELLDRQDVAINLKGARFEWLTGSSEFDPVSNKWARTSKVEEMNVADILVQICEEALEETGIDWYNNEGGYGDLTIDLTTQPTSVVLNVNVRETISHHSEHDLTDEDEESEEEDAPTSSQSD